MEMLTQVLLVDDEEGYCREMRNKLEQHGFLVETALTGPDALLKVQAYHGSFHVALIDQRMGPPNGTEIMIRLRQAYPSIQVIILTGVDDSELGKRAMEEGAFRYILKQTDVDELVLNIQLAARFGLEQQRGQGLKSLVSAGQKISAVKSDEELYWQIYNEARALLPSLDALLISYYEKYTQEVRFPFCYKGGKRFEIPARKNRNGITEYVLRNTAPLLLRDGDYEFRKELGLDLPDQNLGYATSQISVPMFMGDEIFGSISVLTFNPQSHFTDEQLEVLQSFANQAVAVIGLVQRMTEAKQLHDAALKLAGKRGKQDVLSAIVEGAHELIGSDYTGLIMQDDTGFLHKVRPVVPEYFYDRFEEPRQDGGVTRWVIENRKPKIMDDTNSDTMVKDSVRAIGIQSMLAFPLIHGERVLGVLYAHNFEHRSFNTHDVALWTAFASQAAATLDSAIQEEMRIDDYVKFSRASSLLDEVTGLDQMLVRVASAAKFIFEADECRLGYIDPPTGRISKWASPVEDVQSPSYKDVPRANGITRRVIETRQPVFWPALDGDEHIAPHPELLARGLKSMAALPLVHNGRCIGVLHCYFFNRKRSLSEHIRTLMELFCLRAAMALGRSYRETLNAIWRDLDRRVPDCSRLDDLYILFLEHARDALKADFAVFYPFDPTTLVEDFRPTDDKSYYVGELLTPWQKPSGGAGGGVVHELRQTEDGILIINDLESHNGSFMSRIATCEQVRSFIALRLEVSIPVGNRRQLAGLMFLNYRYCTAIERSDLAELLSAASLIAAGILRMNLQAALQKSAQQRNNQLRAVVEIFQAFENKVEGLSLDIIAEKARTALRIDVCTLLEYDRKARRFTGRGASGLLYVDEHYTLPTEFASRYMELSGPTEIMNIQNDAVMRKSEFVIREKIKSVHIYPLKVEDEALGLFFASYRELHGLSPEEQEAMGLFADMAGLVLRDMQRGNELSEVHQMLNRRLFLTWISMVEATWRHSIVQKVTSIRNYSLQLQMQLNMLPDSAVIDRISLTEIDRLAKEIAAAPPRVPQSWEMDPELIPLAPLLREVGEREVHTRAVGTNYLHNLNLQTDGLGGVQVKGYRRWLIYLLELLLQNSLAAMPKGGTITISGRRQDAWAEIRIQDTGSGIPENIRNSLFKEIVNQDQLSPGMGIGALLASTLVEVHGGRIELERPGPGDTTILILLPISE